MHTWEVGLITSQLITSLGCEWDQADYEALVHNMPGLRLSTLLTLLESKYLTSIDQAVVEEAVTGLSHTFVDDVIKKVKLYFYCDAVNARRARVGVQAPKHFWT